MFETKMILSDNDAANFRNMMSEPDLEALYSRDLFIADIDSELDDDGTLVIDVSNSEIDFLKVHEENVFIESTVCLRNDSYADDVEVVYTAIKTAVSSRNCEEHRYKEMIKKYSTKSFEHVNLITYAA